MKHLLSILYKLGWFYKATMILYSSSYENSLTLVHHAGVPSGQKQCYSSIISFVADPFEEKKSQTMLQYCVQFCQLAIMTSIYSLQCMERHGRPVLVASYFEKTEGLHLCARICENGTVSQTVLNKSVAEEGSSTALLHCSQTEIVGRIFFLVKIAWSKHETLCCYL